MRETNLVIIGKSGIGKSSLLNYLLDKDVAETGSGEPVTKQGFHLNTCTFNHQKLNIYDSWGIEAGKTEVWMSDFERFLNLKESSTEVRKWIHRVIICISAEGKRIEEFEKRILNKLRDKSLSPVIVITKSDLDQSGDFYNSVCNEFKEYEVIKVCSVEKSVGLGISKKISKKMGREVLLSVIDKNAAKSIKIRVLSFKENYIKERGRNWEPFFSGWIDKIIFGHKGQFNLLGNIGEDCVKSILKDVDGIVKVYNNDTERKLNKFYEEVNLLFSDLYILKSEKIISKKFADNIDVNKSKFINSHPDFKEGRSAYLSSIKWGPIGLAMTAFSRNKGISEEDLKLKLMGELKIMYS